MMISRNLHQNRRPRSACGIWSACDADILSWTISGRYTGPLELVRQTRTRISAASDRETVLLAVMPCIESLRRLEMLVATIARDSLQT